VAATTLADADAPATPDLVERDFTADAPGVKLVGDITYIPTWQGFVYLATVIDCHSKLVAGYAIADHMRAPLVCDAIAMAAKRINLAPQAIFHSDQAVSTHRSNSAPNCATATCGLRSDGPGCAGTTPWPNRSTPR
jgi:putative transposase